VSLEEIPNFSVTVVSASIIKRVGIQRVCRN
jgi:hypothetical protein